MEPIRIVRRRISRGELRQFLHQPFAEMVKFVVDLEQQAIALGGELHSDAEEILLEAGSRQSNLWGGNLYPEAAAEDQRIEYTALINIRPTQNNRSMEVLDAEVRRQMKAVVDKLIEV